MPITYEEYLLTLCGERDWPSLLAQAHVHLMEVCPTCRGEWDGTAPFDTGEADAAPEAAGGLLPSRERRRRPSSRSFFLAHYDCELAFLQQMRAIARRARQDLTRLLAQPEETWPALVSNARKRFCSLAFVELVVDHARSLVRTAPERAAALAAIVPLALDRLPSCDRIPEARTLRLRGTAHHANALRVAGDLPAAQRLFGELRRTIATGPEPPPAAVAEIASLEATLRTAQRRLPEAAVLLGQAADAYRRDSDLPGLARTRIQQANLAWTEGDAAESYRQMDAAASILADQPDSGLDLLLCTVTGRILALCELESFGDARRLLSEHRNEYEANGDAYTRATYLGLEGRVEAGVGNPDKAQRKFVTSRDGFLELGRHLDAALASLDVAEALLAAGEIAELRRLATELVPLFKARGVERETLASLRLLAEAVKAETLTATVLAEIRHRLDPAGRPVPLPSEP